MNIIFGQAVYDQLVANHTLLELDTFTHPETLEKTTAYCVLDAASLNTEALFNLDKYTEIHAALMSNYKKQNYRFCHQAIEALRGAWGGQLDSFYDELEQRITNTLETSHEPSN